MEALPLRTAFVHPKFMPSDLRIWPCRGPARLAVVFIPGNPGFVDFYNDFHSSIHASLGDEAVVYAVGHLGHSADYPVSWRDAFWPLTKPVGAKPCPSLDDQVRHKVAFIDWVAEKHRDAPVVLISHSVGSFISTKVMAARPEKVAHAYCLFPTISHIALSPNGVRATPFFNPYTLLFVTFLDSLLLLLPAFFLKLLVGLVTRHREPALTVTTSIVSTPCAVSEALYMALDELDTIKDLDRSFLESFGDRLTFYWAEGERDEWVPDRTVKEIVAVLDTRKSTLKRWYRCDEGMVHAFCLDHSLGMAAKCSRWIRDDHLRPPALPRT